MQLHVRRVIEPVAPPILLLHGLGVSGAVWQAFARRLLPRFAAVAPDLRGHGQSDAPPDGYQSFDYSADCATLIDDLHLAPLPVVGHSLGALVALELAHDWPKLISWVVLLDPPLDAAISNADIPQVYRLRHAAPGELEAYLLEGNPRGGRLLAEQLARMFRQASDGAFETMLARADRAAAPRVEQALLVLQADPGHGGVLGDAAAAALLNRQPRAELHRISGGSHALHASHPAEVARAILAFAERQASGAVSST